MFGNILDVWRILTIPRNRKFRYVKSIEILNFFGVFHMDQISETFSFSLLVAAPSCCSQRGMDFVTRRVKILVAHAKLLGDVCPGSDRIPVYRLVNGWFIPDYSFSWTNREGVLDLAYHDCFQCAYLTETRLFQGVFKLRRHVPLDCIEIIVVHASCCAPSHATWRAIIYCMICLFSLGD